MGKVNVTLPGGRVVSVDEDVAATGGLSPESAGAGLAREHQDVVREKFGGVEGAVGEALVSAGDTLSLGGLGAAANLIGGKTMQEGRQNSENEHPYAHTIGEVGAFLLPTGELGGLKSGLGMAADIGEDVGRVVGSKTVGRAVEGGIFGVGSTISESNVSGDPLTVEGLVEGATVGGLLQVGAGKLTDRLFGAANAARAGQAEAASLGSDADLVENQITGKGLLKGENDLPSWTEVREAHSAAQSAAESQNRVITRGNAEYEDFVSSNKDLTDAVKKAQNAIDEVRNYYSAARNAELIDGKWRRVETTLDTKTGDEARILKPTEGANERFEAMGKAPMSEETGKILQDYKGRISGILKEKAGNYRLDEGGKWLRDESIAADPRGALENLRALQDDFAGRYSMASGKLAELPDPPRTLMPLEKVSLPKSLADFPRMHADTVAKFANNMSPETASAFGRLTGDLGLKAGDSVADTVAGVHKTLGDYVAAADRVDVARNAATAKESKSALLNLVKKGAKYTGAAVLGAHGVPGAMLMAVADEAMGSVERRAIGSEALKVKLGLKSRVRDLVAKYGEGAGTVVSRMAPVTQYLSKNFLSGEPDRETDTARQALNRMHEIRSAAATAPDAMYLNMQPMMGDPSNLALKLHHQVVGAINYLNQSMPVDPGLNVKMGQSGWTPDFHDQLALAYQLEAIQHPMASIERALSGDAHPAAIDALWACSPATMQELGTELSLNMPRMSGMTYELASAYSQIFRTPMSPLDQPEVVLQLQAMFLPQNPAGGGGGSSGGGGGGGGGVGGRPPAIQSTVAGSSVSGLIQQ